MAHTSYIMTSMEATQEYIRQLRESIMELYEIMSELELAIYVTANWSVVTIDCLQSNNEWVLWCFLKFSDLNVISIS